LVCRYFFRFGFVAQHKAMTQYVGPYRLDIFWRYVAPPTQKRVSFAS
jgi:hypothetical protein